MKKYCSFSYLKTFFWKTPCHILIVISQSDFTSPHEFCLLLRRTFTRCHSSFVVCRIASPGGPTARKKTQFIHQAVITITNLVNWCGRDWCTAPRRCSQLPLRRTTALASRFSKRRGFFSFLVWFYLIVRKMKRIWGIFFTISYSFCITDIASCWYRSRKLLRCLNSYNYKLHHTSLNNRWLPSTDVGWGRLNWFTESICALMYAYFF